MKKLFSLFVLLLITLSINAVPAKRGLVRTLTLQNGKTVQATLVGDEFGHFLRGTDGKAYRQEPSTGYYVEINAEDAIAKAKAKRAKSNARRMQRLNPTPNKVGSIGNITGSKKGLIILVNFSDKTFNATNADFQKIANQQNYTSGNYKGSMYDYFKAQSDGQFLLSFDVVGPYTVSNTCAYYGGNDSDGNDEHPATMVIEALQLANADVNYADYDWDNDGEVEQVYVVYAGKGEADGGSDDTIWPHEWQLSSAKSYGDGSGKQRLDGVYIDTYACGGELNGQTGATTGIGTMCHEFSHCLGYPDFYDTDYSGGQGMFEWDLMDSGSYNGDGYRPSGYTGWERWAAGWKTPIELSATQTVTGMKGLQDGGESYIIYNTGNSNEYYMLENRSNSAWDQDVPGYGLLIVHVDYNSSSWSNNTPNDDPSHQRMTWVAADNNYQYTTYQGTKYYTTAGAANDVFPYGSVNSFGPSTTPAASWYNNNASGVKYMDQSILNITKNSSGLISFNFQGLSNVATPTFSPEPGRYADAQTVTISCTTSGASIYYTLDGSEPTTSSALYNGPISVPSTMTIKAIAVANNEQSATATGAYTIGVSGDDFELVTNTSGLVSGNEYIIGCGSQATAAGAISSQIMGSVDVTVDGNVMTKTDDVIVFTATETNSGWTFYSEGNGYLYATAAKKLAWSNSAQYWTLSNGTAGVIMTYGGCGTMLYNVSSPRFTTYTSSASATMIQANLYMAVTSSSTTTVPAPILYPAAGEVAAGTVVNVQNHDGNYMYFYTTDGTEPNCDDSLDPTGTSQVYNHENGITVNTGMTIKVIAAGLDAVSTDVIKSTVTSATYTIAQPKAATPTFSPAGGEYSAAQSVTLSCSTSGATIYYTTDGTTPSTSSTVYNGAIAVSSTTTIKAIAAASGYSNSDVATATYTINLPQVATPTFSPAAGNFTEAQNVTLSCTTSGATIHYTIDGTTPTASSTTYTGAINVASTTTIKAIAMKSGMADSEIAEATYNFIAGGSGVFERVEDANDLVTGANYLLVYDGGLTNPTTARIYAGIGGNSNNIGTVTDEVTITNNQIDNNTAGGTVVVLVKNGNNWYIKDGNNYLAYTSTATSSNNNLWSVDDSSTNGTLWTISISGSQATIQNVYNTSRTLYYNTGSPRICGYTSAGSTQKLIAIYKEISGTVTPTVTAPTFTPAAGSVAQGTQVTVSNYNSDYMYFYTTDGTDPDCDSNLDPTGTSQVYDHQTGIVVNSDVTIKMIAVDEDVNKSTVTSVTYTVIIPQVATPTFTPAAGSYTETQSVTIACATDGATIYYTIDGTDPTDPTAAPLTYSEAISVSETTTIKAYATKSGMTDSEIASATYTISSGSSGVGTGIFERVATTAGLEDGANYLLVYDGGTDSPTSARIYTGIASNNYGIVTSAQTVTNLQIDNNTAGGTVVVLIKNGDNWYIKDSETEKYLAYTSTATSSSNNLWGVSSASSNGTEWTISIASGVATIQNVYNDVRTMRFNTSANQDRIACYVTSNTFPKVELYKEITSSSSVAAPTFSPAEGTYNTAQSVTLACATDGATIYYTTDGTEPTSSSNEYTGAITVDHTMTIQAIAMVGSESSTPASATYTLKALAPTFSLAEDTYTSVQSVTLACATTGSTIYYTTDGSDPTSSSNEYTGAITVDHTMTIKAIAVKTGWEDSDVASATYTINLPPAVEAPVFSPNGGSFSAPQVVTITSATEGAVIYYTTNGNDLDPLGANGASLTNGQSVTLTSSCTLKAVAVKGSDTSAQTTASFTIGGGGGTTRYERISSTTDLVDGEEYLIVCENDNLIFDGSLTSLDAEGNKYDVTIVTTGTVPYIESTTAIDNRTFTIDTYNSGKSIQAKSGKYIGCTTSKNSLAVSDSEILNAISFDGTDAQIVSNSRYLRYNNASTNGTRFRYYGTGQQQVQLYKKVTASSAPATITATVSSVGYSTLFYGDMNLIVPDGVEAYTYTITNGVPVRSKTYSPSGANTIIPAGEAVVLKANAGTYEFTVTTDDAETDDFSDMKGSDVTALTEGGVKYYKMSLNAQQEMGSVGWYFGASGGGAFTNGAHKAYLAVPQAKASQMLSSGFPFSGETTAIDGFVIGDSVLQNAAVFDMQGRRMPTNTQLPKGIYIINGKKFVVK